MKLTRFSSVCKKLLAFGTISHTGLLVHQFSRLVKTFRKSKSDVCQNTPTSVLFLCKSANASILGGFFPILNSYFPISAFKGKIEREKVRG